MSGHSKWSKVKHQKAATDAVRGKIFTKMSNAIIIAVKQGGGVADPDSNFKLRLAIDRAKSVNMPKENIMRAIEKAAKSGDSENMSEIVYEAYGPAGVAVLIKAVTDNKQRTVAEVKNLLERGGGVLAAQGSVSRLFSQVGLIEIGKEGRTFDEIFELATEAGAIDIEDTDEAFLVYTDHGELHKVREFLQTKVTILSAELSFRTEAAVRPDKQETREKIEKLLDAVEDMEDVQRVYTNYQPV
ncbi:MAG: hypothetical protein UV73_C0009G0027 [Candidatus Gottesmanbacteria bacterium GW2011_GWA2_43_14]|uniref:Probable transcriptional regulatory protein UV73_C0009G0027 n=1 Tax=Candidatus Gottesmanbacteria bacterium GW2011_GWA2_43_14 TaxID=1618443 RepID=A0A0G1FNV4_9BACT|nr:MAG: hypothetical protein UV73_C0009G0027 [Candidatus Gottesmanbacteria bacterium GW2011_GWA2_43_14]